MDPTLNVLCILTVNNTGCFFLILWRTQFYFSHFYLLTQKIGGKKITNEHKNNSENLVTLFFFLSFLFAYFFIPLNKCNVRSLKDLVSFNLNVTYVMCTRVCNANSKKGIVLILILCPTNILPVQRRICSCIAMFLCGKSNENKNKKMWLLRVFRYGNDEKLLMICFVNVTQSNTTQQTVCGSQWAKTMLFNYLPIYETIL